jgi:hypothetical protein
MSDRTVPALQLNVQNTKDCSTSKEGQEPSAPLLARPEEILSDPILSKEEKRAVLASWLSDARALPDAPRWRQLDNGALVDVDDLYAALRVLDDLDAGVEKDASGYTSSTSWHPRRKSRWIGNFIRRKRDEDDDGEDPPPVPALIRVPPRGRPPVGQEAPLLMELAA